AGGACTGSIAGAEGACSGLGEAFALPARTFSVLTNIGRMGSVEPTAIRGCAAALPVSGSDPPAADSACATLNLSAVGMLAALARSRVAAAGAAAAQDHGDDVAVSPMHRSDQIESGSADIAGLDAVHALHSPKQVIVIADPLSAERKRAGGKIFVIAGEAFLN